MMPIVRDHMTAFICMLALSMMVAAGAIWRNNANLWFMETSREAGLVLTDMQISGLNRTRQSDVLAVLDVDNGMPLLAINLEILQQKVEALPWIKQADVTRSLRGELKISITERVPYALAQKDGNVSLIDANGVPITDRGLGEFSHLMLVVGEISPEILHRLEAEKAKAPSLGTRIKSAVRVGNRRWDLIFDNGIRIRLPAEQARPYGFSQAWEKFAELNKRHGLLEREISVIDMRQPDRLVVRVTPTGRRQMAGKEWAL